MTERKAQYVTTIDRDGDGEPQRMVIGMVPEYPNVDVQSHDAATTIDDTMYRSVPLEPVATIRVRFVNGGELKPLPYSLEDDHAAAATVAQPCACCGVDKEAVRELVDDVLDALCQNLTRRMRLEDKKDSDSTILAAWQPYELAIRERLERSLTTTSEAWNTRSIRDLIGSLLAEAHADHATLCAMLQVPDGWARYEREVRERMREMGI